MTEKPLYFDPSDRAITTMSDAGSVVFMDALYGLSCAVSNSFGDGSNILMITNDVDSPMIAIGLDAIDNPLEDECVDGNAYLLHCYNPRGTYAAPYDCALFMDNAIDMRMRKGTYLIMPCLGLSMETRAPSLCWKNWHLSMLVCRISPAIVRKTALMESARPIEWHTPPEFI